MADSATPILFDPDGKTFPLRKDLPSIPGAPEGAAWLWGKDDQIGRLNLLTPARVKAASAEIKNGIMVPLKYVEELQFEGFASGKKHCADSIVFRWILLSSLRFTVKNLNTLSKHW